MKKKLFAIAIAACILALSIAGSSLAYFTNVEEYTNVFTAGNVDITLTYASTITNSDEEIDLIDELTSHVYPGQTYQIGATISNIGNEAAYVGAIITLTDDELSSFVTTGPSDADKFPVAVRELLVGLASATDYTVKYTVSADTKVMTIYVVKNAALAAKTTTTTDSCEILNSIVIPAEWDNAEMAAFAGLKLNVIAYATQTVGFAEADGRIAAENALLTAFTAWSGYASATVLG